MWFDLRSVSLFLFHLGYRSVYYTMLIIRRLFWSWSFWPRFSLLRSLLWSLGSWGLPDRWRSSSWQTCGNSESPYPPKDDQKSMIRRFFSKNKKYVRQFSGKITFWIFPPMSDLQIDCPISGVVAAWLSLSFQSFLRFPPRSAGLIVFLKPSLSVLTSRLLFLILGSFPSASC